MIEQAKKEQIDRMSVGELLSANRSAPIGDPRFQGYEGAYRMKRLAELRSEDNDAYVRSSKSIGW